MLCGEQDAQKRMLDPSNTDTSFEIRQKGVDCFWRPKVWRESNQANVYIASLITSYGRLKLYQQLRRIERERFLYCDTDSIQYIRRIGKPEIRTGNLLGDWKDELVSGGNRYHMVDCFVCPRKKTYSYTLNCFFPDGTFLLKTKSIHGGIRHNAMSERLVTPTAMKDVVLDGKTLSVPSTRTLNDFKKRTVVVKEMPVTLKFDGREMAELDKDGNVRVRIQR